MTKHAMPTNKTPLSKQKFLIWGGLVLVCLCMIVGGHSLVAKIEIVFGLQGRAATAMLDHPAIIALIIIIYMVLLAIPFIPGAELGLMLMLVFGAAIAPVIYLATFCALLLAFATGRLVCFQGLLDTLAALGLSQLAAFLKSKCDQHEDAAAKAHQSWANTLVKNRMLSLGLLLNVPGNTLIGGGGGIAMSAGASRLVSFRAFALLTAVAIAPMPGFFIVAEWFAEKRL